MCAERRKPENASSGDAIAIQRVSTPARNESMRQGGNRSGLIRCTTRHPRTYRPATSSSPRTSFGSIDQEVKIACAVGDIGSAPGGCGRRRRRESRARRIPRRPFARRMQRLQECHQRGGLRRTEIVAVRRHVAPTLQHLPNQLILRQPRGHTIQGRSALAPQSAKRVTVAALLGLEHDRALPLQRTAAGQIHVRAPGRCSTRS